MAKIKSVQAADPGVGFVLEFDNGELSGGNVLPNLLVALTITTPQGISTSSVSVTNTISDTDPYVTPYMVFVVPFGDTAYAPGQQLTIAFNVTYTRSSNVVTLINNYSETVEAQGGSFIVGLGS